MPRMGRHSDMEGRKPLGWLTEMDDSNRYYCIMQILNIQILNLLNQHLQELTLTIVIKEEQKISLILFS